MVHRADRGRRDLSSIWDAKQLTAEQLIDVVRATVVHAGGLTHLRRIAAPADLYQVRTGCHGATDLARGRDDVELVSRSRKEPSRAIASPPTQADARRLRLAALVW